MSWVQLHSGSHRHWKVIELARILGCSDLEARGLVMTMWSWTGETSADGDIRGWSAHALARAWGWLGDADALVSALIEVRLLDGVAGSLRVHEWLDYCPNWKEAQRKAAERAMNSVSADSPGQSDKRPRVSKNVRSEKRREEKRREEKRSDQESNLGSAADGSSEATSPAILFSLPLIGGKAQPVTEEDVLRWSAAFPGVDVVGELARMASWLDANPTRRPKSSAKAFAHRWLTKAQNDAGGRRGPDRESATQFAWRLAQEERARESSRGASPDSGQLRLTPPTQRYTARSPPLEPTADLFGEHEEAQA